MSVAAVPALTIPLSLAESPLAETDYSLALHAGWHSQTFFRAFAEKDPVTPLVASQVRFIARNTSNYSDELDALEGVADAFRKSFSFSFVREPTSVLAPLSSCEDLFGGGDSISTEGVQAWQAAVSHVEPPLEQAALLALMGTLVRRSSTTGNFPTDVAEALDVAATDLAQRAVFRFLEVEPPDRVHGNGIVELASNANTRVQSLPRPLTWLDRLRERHLQHRIHFS